MSDQAADVLDSFRLKAGLSHGELWLRYFELGGMSTGFELEAFLYGMLSPTTRDHDVIAHALNERFTELGKNHPVAYQRDVHEH
jgi:predicted DNA-binding ribbon-helix-helix protein